MAYPDDIYDWAREALDANESDLADARLSRYLAGTVRTLIQQYPCIAGGSTSGSLSLSGEDLDSFMEAAGYRIGARFLRTPAGRRFAGNVQEIRVGPVTEKRGSRSVEAMANDCLTAAAEAMNRITCVRSAIISGRQENDGDMYALAGRRRQIGEPNTIEGMAIGGGQVDVVETTTGDGTVTTFYP